MSTLPPAAAAANVATLTDALAAAHISDSPEVTEKPLEEKKEEGKEEKTELEEGEIKEDDGTPKTVFHDAQHFNLKHPLFSKWTLYFDSPQSKALPKTPLQTPTTPAGMGHGGWLDDIRKVVDFDSVEEFWGVYNNIVLPSQLPGKANYYLFKNGIIPAWEDPQNKNGGKWAIQVPKDKSRGAIDKMWLYTMLAAIGETFETPQDGAPPADSDLITGVIVSCRGSFYRIALWTRAAPDVSQSEEEDELMKRIMTIGRFFKVQVLGYALDQKLVTGGFQTEVTFDSHKDSEKKGNKQKIVI